MAPEVYNSDGIKNVTARFTFLETFIGRYMLHLAYGPLGVAFEMF